MLRGARLNHLFQQAVSAHKITAYDYIWDLCCDHGFLGQAFLHRFETGNKPHIVFVDQHKHITEPLKDSLRRFSAERFTVLSNDARRIQLQGNNRHLLIIAGVGGELCIEIIKCIQSQHSNLSIDFLICPTNSMFFVRQQLQSLPLKLCSELIIKEGKWFYQLLLLKEDDELKPSNKISCVGNMWDKKNTEHLLYLQRLIQHYQNKVKSQPSAEEALEAYQALYTKLVS